MRPRSLLPWAGVLAFGLYEWRRWRQDVPTLPPLDERPFMVPQAGVPRVSILVPAWKPGPDLHDFLAHYRRLNWPNLQLVLCVGGPDGSLETARREAGENLLVLEQAPGEGKQRALDRCLDASGGELILLTDIDCLLTDEVIGNLYAGLERSGSPAVTGASRPLPAQAEVGLVQSHYATEQATLPRELSPTTGILGRSALIRREVLVATRAFSVPAPSGTDYTLAKTLLAAGYAITFVPGHEIQTAYPDTLPLYAHKQARWLRNVVVLGRRYGAVGEVRAVTRTLALPFVLLGGLGAGLLLPPLALLPILAVLHAAVGRAGLQRRAGLKPSLQGSLLHVLGDLWAALRASRDLLLGRNTW